MTQEKKPNKLALLIGDAVGVLVWGGAAWWAHPHWSWWLLALMCAATSYVLLKELLSE